MLAINITKTPALILSLYISLNLSLANASSNIALVIGNNDYAEVPQLKKAVNDANAIAKKLADLGFDVVITQNVSYRGMSRSLTELENKIKIGDNIFFYFAGHGFAVDGTNYLLPVDVPKVGPSQDSMVKDSSFAVSSISDRLQQKGANTIIMILDACRDNPFAIEGKRSIGQTRGLARIDPAEGIFVLFSAGQGQAALDTLSESDNNPNSIFTRTLLKELGEPSLSMIQIAKKTQLEVKNLAGKVGHVQIPAYYDQVIGELYLSSPTKSISSTGKIETLGSGNGINNISELDNEQSNIYNTKPIASFSNFSGRKGDGFDVMISLPEPAIQFSYRLGENGDFIDAGLTKEYDQQTRRRKPNTEFSLPASQEETIIYVTWKDKRGEQSEIYPIPFDPDKELFNMQRDQLEQTDSGWVALDRFLGGEKRIFFSHLMMFRCAIKRVYYGLNDGPLESIFDLGPCNKDDLLTLPRELADRVKIIVPDSTTSISVKLEYIDGTQSVTRKYIENGFAGKISSGHNSLNISNAISAPPEIKTEENKIVATKCNLDIKTYQDKFEDCIKRNALTTGNNNVHALDTMNIIISKMRDEDKCAWFDEVLNKQEIEKSARRKISNKYLSLADAQIKQNKYNSAQEYLKSARYIDPTNNSAQDMAKLIKNMTEEPKINSSKQQKKSAPASAPSSETSSAPTIASPGKRIPWSSGKTTGYIIPGEVYMNTSGQQCRTIEQVVEKNGQIMKGKTTACKTANGWTEAAKD